MFRCIRRPVIRVLWVWSFCRIRHMCTQSSRMICRLFLVVCNWCICIWNNIFIGKCFYKKVFFSALLSFVLCFWQFWASKNSYSYKNLRYLTPKRSKWSPEILENYRIIYLMVKRSRSKLTKISADEILDRPKFSNPLFSNVIFGEWLKFRPNFIELTKKSPIFYNDMIHSLVRFIRRIEYTLVLASSIIKCTWVV